MKVAKADKKEFDGVYNFINVMEGLFDDRFFFSQEESWRDWDDEDEDKQMLLEIEKELKLSEYDDEPDNRLIVYEFIKRKWRKANYCGSFGRIIMDADVLIDNACDPDLDYLEFKPEILKAMEEYKAKQEVEKDGQES